MIIKFKKKFNKFLCYINNKSALIGVFFFYKYSFELNSSKTEIITFHLTLYYYLFKIFDIL